MSNANIVEVVNGRSDLADDGGDLVLFDLFLLEFFVEGASVHVLEDDVEVSLIVEEAIHLKDIAVFDAALDPDLKGQLVHHHVRLYQSLRNLLKREEAVRFLMPYQVNAPELTLPKLLVDHKFIDYALTMRSLGTAH